MRILEDEFPFQSDDLLDAMLVFRGSNKIGSWKTMISTNVMMATLKKPIQLVLLMLHLPLVGVDFTLFSSGFSVHCSCLIFSDF